MTADLMPTLVADLARLVAIPSVAFPGYPPEPVTRAAELTADLLLSSGVPHVELLPIPGQPPTVVGRIPGSPTVLLYAHYDVQPPGDPAAWTSPPFEPTLRDGALHGRGTADDKGNLAMHLGAIRAWGGRPPVGVTIVVEGQEEYGAGLAAALDAVPPEYLDADVAVIADTGNVRPGVPTLGLSLRGIAEVDVEVCTMDHPVHSGSFGGLAPDALLALIRVLDGLVDEHGAPAVPGLLTEDWADRTPIAVPGARVPQLSDSPQRLYAAPALTVIGLDAAPVDNAINVVPPYARARISMRLAPGQDPVRAQDALVTHLERQSTPVTVTRRAVSGGVRTAADGPGATAAAAALTEAWGVPTIFAADGGSVPFAGALQRVARPPEVVLFGVQDAESGLHGPNERVLLDELAKGVTAEADLFHRLKGADDG
ncbi:M20/M25/M40 family metallo-hydrolase [Cryptosporangium sp. NPDC048952]|uniref:M20/M25/M40 family metallo-hydrolase n=1 Tax=Cryptosporangium sp. NPDC048952 TaxID=3363961 RepID=UPI0037129EEE